MAILIVLLPVASVVGCQQQAEPTPAPTTPPAPEGSFPCQMTVYLDVAQTITGGTVTKVEFDTVQFDNNGEWDSTNKRWVAKEAGVYACEIHLAMTMGVVSQQLSCFITRNGTHIAQGWGTQEAAGCAWPKAFILIDLAAGDYLEGYCYHTRAGVDLDLSTDIKHCGFSVWRVVGVNP